MGGAKVIGLALLTFSQMLCLFPIARGESIGEGIARKL